MVESSSKSSEDKTLGRLISELSLEERNKLLEKLRSQTTLSFEPLYESVDEEEKGEDFETRYIRLPWYYRLAYFILSFFKNKSPFKIFEDSQVGSLGRKIEAQTTGLYDYQRNLLLPEFYDKLSDLKEAGRFFFTALDSSVNRDKGSFYAFLGSLEMGDIHKQLQTDTAPEAIAETRLPGAAESELRQAALKTMEDILEMITDAQRNIMYYNARSLNCLKELSSFLFDRVLLAFDSSIGMQTCPVGMVRELLVELNNILFSLKEPPTLALLESLFIFLLQEKKDEPGGDVNDEIRSLLFGAEDAIAGIRNFNRTVPLTNILRCACRDMSFAPHQISGGEDWFQVYCEHWKRQTESGIADFARKRKHRELSNAFRHFFKGADLMALDNAVSDSNPNGVPAPETFTLSFLQTFHSAVFIPVINIFLRPILIDGEFFKKENRAEFTIAYNDIMKMEDDIKKFDLSIAPNGEYGKRYIQAKDEMSSLPVKRRKIQAVLEDASRDAGGIIGRTRNAAVAMINVLGGILKKEAGGKYDSLSNLEKIAGKTPEVFLDGVAESIRQFQETLQILKDIDAMGSLW